MTIRLPRQPLRAAGVGLVITVCLAPVVWHVVTSLKSSAQLIRLPPLLPIPPTLAHYERVLFESSALRPALVNSLLVAGGTTVLAVLIGSLCAFAVARLPLGGKPVILGFILALSMFPPIATISPLYLLARAAGLRDTVVAVLLIHTTYALPLVIWVLTNAFRQIPVELYWAARVDGCTPWRALWSVVLPPALPNVAAAGLLVFIFSWNEFLFALTLTATDRARTAPVAIALFPGLHDVPWGDMAAASIIVTLPVVVLTILFQRRLVSGLTGGSLKG